MPTHWEGPLLGSHRAVDGLCENISVEVVARRDVIFWFDDFIQQADFAEGATASWISASLGVAAAASTVLTTDLNGGILRIDAGTADATGIQSQHSGNGGAGAGLMALNDNSRDNKIVSWEALVRVTPVTDGVALVGMCVEDTTLLTAADPALEDFTDGVYFMINSGTIQPVTQRAGTVRNAGFTATVANNTFVRLGMKHICRDVSLGTGNTEIYINGALRGRLADGIPSVGLVPSLAVVNGTGTDNDMDCDYFWVCAER